MSDSDIVALPRASDLKSSPKITLTRKRPAPMSPNQGKRFKPQPKVAAAPPAAKRPTNNSSSEDEADGFGAALFNRNKNVSLMPAAVKASTSKADRAPIASPSKVVQVDSESSGDEHKSTASSGSSAANRSPAARKRRRKQKQEEETAVDRLEALAAKQRSRSLSKPKSKSTSHSPRKADTLPKSSTDSDIEEVASPAPGKKNRKPPAQARELTPPPVLSDAELAAAKMQLRRNPVYDLDADDESFAMDEHSRELDPAILAAMSTRRTMSPPVASTSNRLPSAPLGDGYTRTGQFMHDRGSAVALTVRMKGKASQAEYDQLSTGMRMAIWHFEQPIHMEIYANDSFEQIFRAVSSQKTTPREDLMLEYDKKPVYSSATPNSLNMIASATVYGYRKDVWERVKRQRQSARLPKEPSIPPPDHSNALALAERDVDIPEEEEEEEAVPENHVRLKIRCRGYPDMDLEAAKSSKLRAVLKHYLKHNQMSDKMATARIEFDAEELDLKSKIIDTDLEDEDLVEIIIV